ncbi:alpha/beta hydrolase [Streptomyces dysideae]|uniref:Alpha/beta hydrolase n=1 Tax=Streptomyces dysideae TaxID=909626 RepID=A0A117S0S9_9ACTN|nr:alpha/beta hydrolase [Streptomyces dysideae]
MTVAYERQGTGEAVVLLHGLGCHRQAWDAVVPLLTGRREIIAMDLPGFGQSPDLDRGVPRDLETAVAWLGSVFTALGVERPHVVGHSLGGLIALRLGQAGLARSVTALAPAGFWTPAERRYAYALLTAAHQGVRLLPDRALEALADTAAARAVLTGTLYGQASLCPPHAVASALRMLRDSAAFQATLRAGRAPHLFAGDIPDVPVTIAWGTRDRLLPPKQAARAQAMIPGARLVPLPDCGHVPMLDAPELLARVILQATAPQPTRRMATDER